MSEPQKLLRTVVDGGYCIGCGACAAVDGAGISIEMDKYGRFQACRKSETASENQALKVCPFSGESANEDVLGKELYGKDAAHHPRIGYYLKTYAGFVSQGEFRKLGSSGGMGTWIVHELLDKGLVDAVIHVRGRTPSESEEKLFGFNISFSKEDVRAGAKSRYYPIEMSGVMDFVKKNPGRYAFVGIPCFVKAVRLLAGQNPVIKDRIKFCVGLVCGHLKSSRFAEMFAWQCDVAPSELKAIDFRKKIPGQGANLYGVEVTGEKNGQAVHATKTNREFFGHNWGHGFMKYEACDYCDDVLAETADIAVGDAWLPQYVNDDQGTNVIVVRNKIVEELVEKARTEGRLHLDDLSPDGIARSQDAGLRHRREGLAYRLYLKDQKKQWRPVKRVQAGWKHLDAKTRRIQELRMKMAQISHEAFLKAREQNQFSVFKAAMDPLIAQYNAQYRPSFMDKVLGKIKQVIKRLNLSKAKAK